MRKIITLLMTAVLITACLAGCSPKGNNPVENNSAENNPAESNPVEGKKVAYIMYMSSSPIFELWSESFAKTAEALGMKADTFFCEDSDEEWKNRILQCAKDGYDGLLVSHGGVDYSWEFLTDVLKEYPNLKIATFDTSFRDENGETKTIDGVVQLFQQDSELASALVEEILAMYPDKAAKNEPVNILQVQEENYIIAFDRRQTGYQLYETEGRIKTPERMAPEDHLNPVSSMQEVAENIIGKYNDGEIDAIWCCYDAYARGVYNALQELGSDIPMVSVDICDEDIQLMAEGKNWKACATTNWALNGEFACRVLALEMAGQYDDIKAASCYYEDPGMWMEIPSAVVTQKQVMSGQNITVKNLSDVAEAAYTDRSFMPSCDWMDSHLITDIHKLDGQAIGVMNGSAFDRYTDEFIRDADKKYYDEYADMAAAVKQGEIAAFLMDEPMARILCSENDGVTYLPERLTDDSYAFAFPKTDKGKRLCDKFNQFLAALKADGTLEELEDIWFGSVESRKTVESFEDLPASNGTVELALKLGNAPFAYIKDGQTVGYDVDIAVRFCKEHGYGLNINSVEATDFLSDVGSGKYDMGASGFTVTEDRAEKVYFSEPNYTGGIVAVVAES